MQQLIFIEVICKLEKKKRKKTNHTKKQVGNIACFPRRKNDFVEVNCRI